MLSATAIFVVALTIFSALLAWAAVSDFRRFIIPNQATLSALVLYPVYAASAPQPVQWQWALALAAIFFVIGFVMYLARAMGAGDAKLLPVVTLWVGPTGFAMFVVVLVASSFLLALVIGIRTALDQIRASEREAGGATVAVAGLARLGRLVGELRHVPFLKLQVPYGVAIAAGGITVALNTMFTTLR